MITQQTTLPHIFCKIIIHSYDTIKNIIDTDENTQLRNFKATDEVSGGFLELTY